jgi:hypothetical protein
MKQGFWKYALFKFLRVIGICSALIGAFGGLVAFGNNLTEGMILAAFLFVGGILLSWYSAFKMRTITIECGIRDAGSGKTSQRYGPTKTKGRNKLILLSIVIIAAVLVVVVFSLLSALPETVTGKLYLQSTTSDWDDESFAMSKNLLNGEQTSNDMWHHPNNFISSPLKQNFKVTELTFQLYHKIVPSDGTYFLIECMFIDVNGEVQTICEKSVTSIENSRTTSYTINFYSNSPQLLTNERLYVRIKVSTGAAWDWYWGDASYPSQITYKGVPQYEEIPVF